MRESCDLVAERVALGEPLGDLAEHAAGCASCRRIAALPAELGAAHREADPGIGFAARMTAGAQHRIVVRRRRRIATGLAAAVAATAIGAFFLTREPAIEPIATTTPTHQPTPATDTKKDHAKDPWQDPSKAKADDDVKTLLRLANVERSSHLSARWARIEKPLAPYRALLKGMTP
jgi:hypothetical protein